MRSETSQPGSRSSLSSELTRHQIQQEIDDLLIEFHARLPREEAKGLGAVYARYSSRFQHSITDQVRSLLEVAIAQKVFVPREFICFDSAVRGYKERRPGLNQLRAILACKDVQVLFVFSTNRLFRKTYKALQFVEEEVVERGIRCIFTKSGVDTADQNRWRMLLQVHAMTDEAVVGMYADHVRSAHEGLFVHGQVHGTIPFGYRGREVAGPMTKRNLSRQALEIDPNSSPWVLQAFRWYVEDQLSITEIARRFNDARAPCGSKNTTGRWTHKSMRYLLANPRYRGWWMYGASQNVWQSKKDYSRQVPRAEPLKSAQFEHLRIVPDALWYQAQERLAQADHVGAGRKARDGDRNKRPRLLNGLFVCPEHNQILYVGGSFGRVMFCRGCQSMPKDKRPLYSQLNRQLALKLTCEKLAALLQQDEALVQTVIATVQREAAALQQPDPSRLEALQARQSVVSRKISFIMDNVGDTDFDRREAEVKLKQLRQERAACQAELHVLENARTRAVVIPSEAEVRSLINDLGTSLITAAQSDDEVEATEARRIAELLTGGRIELFQQGERSAQRGWLQGRFRVRLESCLVEMLSRTKAYVDLDGLEVTIDYRELSSPELWVDRVKQEYDQGKLIKVIAKELGISRNLAAQALDHWYESRSLSRPDGRSRRATLDQQHTEDPPYIQIADEAMKMYANGQLLQEIAAQLNCDRNTLTKAIAHWHKARGLAVPDGRSRRKQLDRPCSGPYTKRSKDNSCLIANSRICS